MPVLLIPAPPISIPFFSTVEDRRSIGGIRITGLAPIWYNWIKDTVALVASSVVSNTAYGVSWSGVTDVAPSKNAVYNKIEALISDVVYGPAWDGVTDVAPSKNAVYDEIEVVIALIASSVAAAISDAVYSVAWNGDTTHAPSKNALYDKINAMISDAAYGVGWNGVTDVAPSKNAVYDEIETVIALIASSVAAVISDTAYGSSWNGVTTIAPSKNAVYDQIEIIIALIASSVAAAISDAVYGAGWNGDTTHAPSKNAVYDKIESMGVNDPATYSPTYGAFTLVNTGAPTAYTTGYERRVNTVRVTGFFDATPTAAGLVQISISLPIASTLTNVYNCRGSGGADKGEGAVIFADTANNVAQIEFTALNNSAHRVGFHYEYDVA